MKKKLLSILLVLCMAATLLPGTALAAEFNDVDGHWGQEAIERWADYGVLNGKGDGVFDPNGVMTRAEFATMLVNMMGYTKTSTDTFSDLNPGAWYADAMSKLVAAGVMNGVGGGRIDPMGQITREQAAVMLCRAFGIKASSTGTIAFQDSGKVSSWARDAMTALSERGMINGVGNNILSPDGIVNRATAAKLTSNMVAEYVTTDKVLSGEINGVVIVAKGAKVEIKDATVTAPIVVESASVSLTNTKAEEVKVAGEKAAVTADKDSTVTDVSIGGEAPAVELNGKVEGTVTVEEGATAPEIKGDGVKADQVVNNTDADVTVNGETVKPEDKPETPSTSDSGSGSGSGNKDKDPEPKPDPEPVTGHTHNWVDDAEAQGNKAASCTKDGVKIQKCDTEDTCPEGGTKEVKIPATGHNYSSTAGEDGKFHCQNDDCEEALDAAHTCDEGAWENVNEPTCSAKGSKVRKCTSCGKILETGEIDETAHDEKDLAAVAPTCANTGLTAGKQCKVCGKVTVEQEVDENKPAHKWSNGKCTVCKTTCEHSNEDGESTLETVSDSITVLRNDCVKGGFTFTVKCSICEYTKTETDNNNDHIWTDDDGNALAEGATPKDGAACKMKGCTVTYKAEEKPEPPECTHDGEGVTLRWDETKGKAICSNCNAEVTCNHDNHTEAGKCTKCTKTGLSHNYDQSGDTCKCGKFNPDHAHEYEYTSTGNNTHSGTCSKCGETAQNHTVTGQACTWDKSKGTCQNCGGSHTGNDHAANADGKCDTCGATVPGTQQPEDV